MRPDQAKYFGNVETTVCDKCHRDYAALTAIVEAGEGTCPYCIRCTHRVAEVQIVWDGTNVVDSFLKCVNCGKRLDKPVVKCSVNGFMVDMWLE